MYIVPRQPEADRGGSTADVSAVFGSIAPPVRQREACSCRKPVCFYVTSAIFMRSPSSPSLSCVCGCVN
jgi:hypothetical protein